VRLRKGKTKSILESSIDSALLAVEIYNKPRTTFRSEGYITLMIVAWTRLFHAHFHNTIGNRYHYKGDDGRYKLIDGERKSWELTTCIKNYGQLTSPVKKNLEFSVRLRNKIEHRHIDKREVDTLIFGECQALLYNYETVLINLFGQGYALNEALVYSLQFSQLRTPQQEKANRKALSKDLTEIIAFVKMYRTNLTDDDYGSQEYSIKLLQIPKISNTNRADAAIDFVRWDELSEENRTAYEQVAVIIKDKKINVSAANVKRYKPVEVVTEVNKKLNRKTLTTNLHVTLYKLFQVRPLANADDPFETIADFCLYDETHKDYVYESAWIDFIVHFMQSSGLTPAQLRKKQREGERLRVADYIA
jgi:hypothetical protein